MNHIANFENSYDAPSPRTLQRTQLTRPNGINTNYAYDSVSHLLSVLHQAGSATLDGASYTYDYAGKTNYLNGVTSNYRLRSAVRRARRITMTDVQKARMKFTTN